MPFAPNDPNINRAGRPRRLERELERLEQAADAIDGVIRRRFLAAALLEQKPPELTPEECERLRQGQQLRDRAEVLRLAIADLRDLVEPPPAPPEPAEPIDTSDPYAARCMTLGVMIDRAISESDPQ